LRQNLRDHTVVRARHLCVDLVGRHFEQRIVELDFVADVLEEGADHTLGHRLTQLRQGHHHVFIGHFNRLQSCISRATIGRRR